MPLRLSKIKMAGFKSFVDPAEISLPTNLCGVVGPNGCGKSNVIDAIRLVMGESSAKNLRGGSISDMIFNGAENRKPVGQASVELIFDNEDGSIGGEYANYSQISVRREITRDGQSRYLLNGTVCRRKDITNLFLGTGLGPRSYSIIEQGMVSRLIEAKPEEFRAFLEEAAQISKYRERRRETQNRISHTRDNLDRLNDIRDELEKQLSTLSRQSDAARNFKVYESDLKIKQAQRLARLWVQYEEELQTHRSGVQDTELALEASRTQKTAMETDITKAQEAVHEAQGMRDKVQSSYYQAASSLKTIEQDIHNRQANLNQAQEGLTQEQQALNRLQDSRQADAEHLVKLEQQVSEGLPELEACKAERSHHHAMLVEAESALDAEDKAVSSLKEAMMKPSQAAEVHKNTIRHLEDKIRAGEQKMSKWSETRGTIDVASMEKAAADKSIELMQLDQEYEQSSVKMQAIEQGIESRQLQYESRREEREGIQETYQALGGRLASLEALQEAALSQDSVEQSNWLEGQSLTDNPRLIDELLVDERWHVAVEAVLGAHVHAICAPDWFTETDALRSRPPSATTLFAPIGSAAPSSVQGLTSITTYIENPEKVGHLLSNIFVADTLDAALSMREQLPVGGSIVLPEGLWLAKEWVKIPKYASETDSILARKSAIARIRQERDALKEQLDALATEINLDKDALVEAKVDRQEQAQLVKRLSNDVQRARSDVERFNLRADQQRQRLEQINSDMNAIHLESEMVKTDILSSRKALEVALEEMEQMHLSLQSLNGRKEEALQHLRTMRRSVSELTSKTHALEVTLGKQQVEAKGIRQTNEQRSQQIIQVDQRILQLNAQIVEHQEQIQRLELDKSMASQTQLEAEQALQQASQLLSDAQGSLSELQIQLREVSEQIETIRTKLEQLNLARQTSLTRREGIAESMAETTFVLEEVLQSLPEGVSVPEFEESIERLERKIKRLGPINLAAIEEFKAADERKSYLDEQHQDLVSALDVLETAINKIDKETRHRFKETFETVNAHFTEIFPKLFGGGRAHLTLTTPDDMLNTGIQVLAQPPGKRNSLIQQLSGGEKALTAVALVFAIFRLNPAPFCLLDEVDAPLDDNNVTRFCELVKSMSDKTQFLFITHNKVTMELADYLMGVTMREPGVSRIVSVNVKEAAEMTAEMTEA